MGIYRNRETGNTEVWDKKPSAGYDSIEDYNDSQSEHKADGNKHYFSGLGKIDWSK